MSTIEMNIQEKTNDNGLCLHIDGILHKHNVGSLHKRLQRLLSRKSNNISLDLSAVQQMDTAAVAVLVVAKRTAIKKQNEFIILQVSQAARDALELAHLSDAFAIA
ncbi:MAG: STAS domain-containing protein [Mariprofundales bacterium]